MQYEERKCPKCGYEFKEELDAQNKRLRELDAQNKRLREWAHRVAERSKKWY